MLSTGANAFQTEQQVYAGCLPKDFAVGDVTGDGIPDLVVVCANSSFPAGAVSTLQAYYLQGIGDGTFMAPVAFGNNAFIGNPTQVVLGDFNNYYNGGSIPYLQIAVIDGVDGVFQVFDITQNSQGPQVNFASTVQQYGPVVAAGAADFNQDGFSDLVLEDYSSSQQEGAVTVFNSYGYGYGFYIGNGSVTFSASSYYVQSMTITDLNNDGYPDVAIADPGGFNDDTGSYWVYLNNGSGALNYQSNPSVNSVGSIAGVPFPVVGNTNSNGTPAASPGWGLVYTYIGDSGDLYVGEATQNATTNFDTGLLPYSYTYSCDSDSGYCTNIYPDFIVAGDLNGDGYLDFALTGETGVTAVTYELQPWYYTDDAQTSLTGATPTPTTSSPTVPLPGNYTVTANYNGNQLYLSSSGSTPVTITAATPAGTLTVNPSSGPYTYGTSLTFSASIIGVSGGAAPTGNVGFFDGGTQFDNENLNLPDGGWISTTTSTTSLLAPGTHNICISFTPGDGNYNSVSNIACVTIQVSSISLSLTSTAPFDGTAFNVTSGTVVNLLVQGANAVIPYGQTVTLTGIPTAAPITPTTNGIGIASYQYGLFSPGSYTIQASFVPPGAESAVTSNTITLNVGNIPVNVALTPSVNPVTYPTAINLTANATTGGLGVPSGIVDFENNGVQFGTGGLSNVNGSSGLTYSGIIDGPSEASDLVTVTGDFNGDGRSDLAVLEGGGTLLVSLGNGDGTFQAAQTFNVDSTAVAMAVADFNKDGNADLVIANSDGTVSVYLSSVTGSAYNLNLSQNVPVTGAIGVATGDFNADGWPDFAVISSTQLVAFYNNQSANFPSEGSWSETSNNSQYTGITIADFNQDQFADIALSDSSGPDAAVFLYNSEGGGFTGPTTYSVGVSASAIASGDVNGDGYPDLAVVSNSDSTVAVLINNGTNGPGTFGAQNSYGIAYQPTAIAMNDFNQDGFSDIAVVGTGGGAGTGTTILLGSATGAMYGETSLPNGGNGVANGLSLATADFNQDGNPDLAVGYAGVSIFLDTSAQASLSGVALPAGTAPLTGVFSAGETIFTEGASATLNEVVNQAVPSITWANPTAIAYGTMLSATQLNAIASFAGTTVPGTFTYTPAAGTVLTAGSQTLSVSFVPNDTVDYAGATATVQVIVNQATTTVSWANPASITYGTALSATQLNATGSVPGTLTYTPAAGTVLTAGIHQLTVDFVPADTVNYVGSTGSVSITVNQAVPSITWSNPAAITYGTALSGTQLNATSSVAGTFTYLPASGTILTAGTHQLSASFEPTDSVDYAVATGSASISVNQATPSITWVPPAAITYGTALSATQLAASSPVTGSFAYNPVAGTVLTAGLHTLAATFTPTDTTDYTTATSSTQLTVNQATPSIMWAPPAAITYGTALSATQLAASSPVAGSFAYNPVAGTVLTAGAHALSVTFTPTDTTDYTSATSTVQLTVNKATPIVSWTNPAAISYGTPLSAAQLDATATVPGAFTYTPVAGSILTAGQHTLSVNFTPTDSTDYSPSTGTASITVNKAVPSIAWTAPPAITYGAALGAAQLDATASTAGTLTYSPVAGTVLGAGPQTLNVSFAPSDTNDYTGATASVPIQVNQAIPVINWSSPAAISFGTQLSATQLDATATPSGGTFTYSPPAGTTLPEGVQTLHVTYVPLDSTDYASAAASVAIQVNSTSLTLNLISSTASTTSGSVVTFQVQASGSATPAGQTVTLTGLPTALPVNMTLNGDGFASYSYGLFPTGTYTVQASFAGSAAFAAATSNTVSLTVDPAAVKVALASSANPVTYPTPINLTANATSDGLGVPTGSISFQDNGIQVGSGTLATANGSSGLASVGTLDSVTGQTVIAVVTGDFNKDGNQDIAALESGPGVATLLISLGNGDGTFKPPVTYSSASFGFDPTSVAMAAGDFNGDGYTDLVIAASDGYVVVLLASGDAAGDLGFSQQIQVSAPLAVATGDFNKDGNQDFAVISANTITAFYGTGSTPSNFPTAGSWSETFNSSNFTGIAVADFNHDGYADIAVSDNAGPDAAVFLYNSGGSGFTEPQTYPIAGSANAIASGDINGDGYPDLVVATTGNSTVDVLINNGPGGNGTFPAGTVYGVGSQPAAIAMNDFNKDGYADIAVAGAGAGQSGGTTVLLGSLSGAMTGEASLAGVYGQSIVSADFNNDGNPDLAVGMNGIAEFLDSGAQASVTSIVLSAGTQPLTAVFTPSASSTFGAATSPVLSEVVTEAGSTISWPNPASITYGTALSTAQLDATSSVPGTFTYSPEIGTVLTVGTHQLNVSFVPNDSVDYVSAAASVSITVTQAGSTVSWSNPTGITYGTALTSTQLDATASVPGTFNYSPALGTVLAAGTHQLSVSFVPNDTADYLGSTATASITVSQASSTITWPAPASIAYGTPLSATQFDATATVPGTFAYTPALGTVLTAGAHTLTAAFTPTDNTDYAAATTTVSITVNRANPSIAWTAPAAITYGTALGTSQLDATPSTPGTLSYNPAAGTVLGAGAQTLSVSFTPTDTTDYNAVTASVPIQVNQATPVITWSNPVAIAYGIQLSATQLNATASPSGGTFTYTPPVGTVLPVGTQILRVSYAPTDTIDYATASASVAIQVNPGLTFASVSPSSGAYQSPSASGIPVTVTLNGTGFASNSVVQLIWASGPTTLSSSYIGPDQLTATIPGSFFQQTQPGAITITNPATGQTSASVPFMVALPNIQVVFTGPSSESEAQQPSLNLQFLDGYPVPLQVTLSLTVQPATPGGPVDPAVQFSTGGTTYSFTLPANSTNAPTILLQTGTLAGSITVTLTLEANDQDVTPAGLQPVVIIVPASAPVLTSVSLNRSGNTLTVTVEGYSSTRDMTSALFNFTPAAGQELQDPQLTVDVATDFSTWYAQQSSIQYGSAFTYTQAFDLSGDASAVGGVSVTLTNSVGTSNVVTAN
jgi:hypothetical protein